MSEMSKHNIKLLNIQAKDAKTYNIRTDFDQAFYFIDQALKSQGKIVINCARGISRSATIVIGYLMFRFDMSLNEAYQHTTRLRPHVRPNSNFRRQLELFEQELNYLKYLNELKQTSCTNRIGMYENYMNASRTTTCSNNSNHIISQASNNITANNTINLNQNRIQYFM